MARPPSTVLTDAELRVMRVLWARGGEATIGDVCDVLDPPAARATVQTMLRILERKRYVRHRAVDHLVERFFDRSEGALVMRLLDRRGADAATLERVRAIIDSEDAS